jgi:hypothetical protein
LNNIFAPAQYNSREKNKKMENNFTSQEHSRDASGNVVMESAGRTIANMRERQRGRNFVNGVIISALALSTILTGVMLGATSRYANNLRAELNTANQQLQSQNYSGQSNYSGSMNGSGTSNYGGSTGTTDGTNTTDSSYNDTTNTSSMNGGNGTGGMNSYGSRRYSGYGRNFRNFNNNNVAPANLPTMVGSGATGTGNSTGTGTMGSSYGGSSYGGSTGGSSY